MTTPLALSEQDAVNDLASHAWTRQGDRLVSRDAFMPVASTQLMDAITPGTRRLLQLAASPRDLGDGSSIEATQLSMDARLATTFFRRQGKDLAVEVLARTR